MAVAYNYSNVSVANTIGTPGGISNAATAVYAATSPVGYPGSFPFKLRLEPGTASEEVVKVTAGAGTAGSPWTIVRGWDGTTAVSHAVGAALAHGMTQEDLALARTHENSGSGSGAHGLPASAWATSAIAVISETTLSNSTSSVVTWSSIPQTYTHLMVVIQGRCTNTGAQFIDTTCTVNGDSAAKYSGLTVDLQTTSGSLTGPTANSYSATGSWQWFLLMAGAQAGSSVNAGGGWAFFPNYAGTSYNKMFVSLSGFGNGTTSAAAARTRWGWYNPTSQVGITSLSVAASVGNFQSGSLFGLYGVT